MSVTISRFVRVMTDGKVVTDSLVSKMDAKLGSQIAMVEELISAVEDQGASAHALSDQVVALKEMQKSAGAGRNNASKSELLERASAVAKRAIAMGQQRALDAHRLGIDAKLDASLAELKASNATIPDDAIKVKAGEKLAALAERRRQLLPGDDGLEDAAQLLKEVGWASSWTESAITFGNASTRIQRNMARNGALMYAKEGKRLSKDKDKTRSEAGVKLCEYSVSITQELERVEDEATRNPREASPKLVKLILGDYKTAETLYNSIVLAPVVLPKAQALIAADSKGPEAQMQDALSPAVFERRLLAVNHIAKVFGTPEINLLSPGEAVALFSYTTGDYSDMNTLLLTGSLDDGVDVEKVKTKIAEATKALGKLPDYPVSPTLRGERRWEPGDGQQYQRGNEFVLKMFWSTGAGFAFGGGWQITVFGKSGKNVAAFSASPHEAEVLYAPGARFRVKSVVPTRAGGRVVVEEV